MQLQLARRPSACLPCRILPEIDMPGHTAALHQAYPELIACYNHLREYWHKLQGLQHGCCFHCSRPSMHLCVGGSY